MKLCTVELAANTSAFETGSPSQQCFAGQEQVSLDLDAVRYEGVVTSAIQLGVQELEMRMDTRTGEIDAAYTRKARDRLTA